MGDRRATTTGGTPVVAYWLGVFPSNALGILACAFLFVMMVFTFADVAGRYLFASPISAAYEIVAFTMPCIIFCALPSVNLHGGHVTIDLLDSFVPAGWRRWQQGTMHIVAAAAMAFIAWRLAARSADHLRFGEVTDELYIPLWAFSAIMAALSGFAVIASLIAAWGRFAGFDAQAPNSVEGPST